jgi:hypothetical protein
MSMGVVGWRGLRVVFLLVVCRGTVRIVGIGVVIRPDTAHMRWRGSPIALVRLQMVFVA